MKFRFKKFIERGVKKYRLLGVEGVKGYYDLPVKYIDGKPVIYLENSGLIKVFLEDGGYLGLKVGSEISCKDYDMYMTAFRDAGNRLHEINKQLKKENTDWDGMVEVVI